MRCIHVRHAVHPRAHAHMRVSIILHKTSTRRLACARARLCALTHACRVLLSHKARRGGNIRKYRRKNICNYCRKKHSQILSKKHMHLLSHRAKRESIVEDSRAESYADTTAGVGGAACIMKHARCNWKKKRPTTYMHIHTHTYIHTCMHTYMHTYIHTRRRRRHGLNSRRRRRRCHTFQQRQHTRVYRP